MKKQNTLTIQKREPSSKGAIKQLRRDGFLPCSMSYKGADSLSFSISRDEFRKALNQFGMTGIYNLQADKKTAYSAMVREIQYAPVSREWLHVTFQRVSLTEETTADIQLNIIGRDDVAYAGYELLQQLETVSVRGLPTDFPPAIDVDVSKMVAGDQITVADLEVPEGLTVETEPDRLILNVSYPRVKTDIEETAQDEGSEMEAAAAPSEDA